MSISLFIKFGSEKNMLDLYENGTIYFSSLEEFRKKVDSKNRDDENEGTISLKHYSEEQNHILKINPDTDKEIKMKIEKAVFRSYLKDIRAKAYSLFSIKHKDIFQKDYKIDNQILSDKKYSHCVIITNVNEFIKRLTEELDRKKIIYKGKSINYYAFEKNQGNLTLFSKTKEFAYQNEYRLVLYENDLTPLKIKIDSIKDISFFCKTDDLKAITIA